MKIEAYLNYKGTEESFIQEHLTPVYYGGKTIPDYFVDKDGEVWSSKGRELRILKWFLNKDKNYPRVAMNVGDIRLKPLVHRIVCETFHETPIPEGVTEDEWERTPESVKNHFYNHWEVRHKDNNKLNYNPNNLEWVPCKQNTDKYKENPNSRKTDSTSFFEQFTVES